MFGVLSGKLCSYVVFDDWFGEISGDGRHSLDAAGKVKSLGGHIMTAVGTLMSIGGIS